MHLQHDSYSYDTIFAAAGIFLIKRCSINNTETQKVEVKNYVLILSGIVAATDKPSCLFLYTVSYNTLIFLEQKVNIISSSI